MRTLLAFTFVLSCLFSPAALAWSWGKEALELPAPAPVVDEFGLLRANQRAELAEVLRAVKAKSGVEIAVYIPSSLRGRQIEEFGIAVADQWKLGKKKEDKGLILLIAPKERKMRFEVGYGLEGDLTDAFSRQVLDNVMRPYFKAGRYYEGIMLSLVALQKKVPLGLDSPSGANERSGEVFDRGAPPPKVVVLLFIFLLIIFVPLMIITRVLQALGIVQRPTSSYHGGGWSSGSGRSGGWSSGGGGSWGGGGGFGGGGASSDW